MNYKFGEHHYKDSELINGHDLADKLGVSPSAITKALKKGRLDTFENSKGKKRFHRTASADQFLGNRNVALVSTATRAQKAMGITDAEAKALAVPLISKDTGITAQDVYDYAEARAENEFHKARLAKLKADELEGNLVDKIKASQKVYELASSVKDRLLAIHLKIASACMSPIERALCDAGIQDDVARNALSIGKIEQTIGEVCRKQIIDSLRDIISKERDSYAD